MFLVLFEFQTLDTRHSSLTFCIFLNKSLYFFENCVNAPVAAIAHSSCLADPTFSKLSGGRIPAICLASIANCFMVSISKYDNIFLALLGKDKFFIGITISSV